MIRSSLIAKLTNIVLMKRYKTVLVKFCRIYLFETTKEPIDQILHSENFDLKENRLYNSYNETRN
jgi:hypothetical protein